MANMEFEHFLNVSEDFLYSLGNEENKSVEDGATILSESKCFSFHIFYIAIFQ